MRADNRLPEAEMILVPGLERLWKTLQGRGRAGKIRKLGELALTAETATFLSVRKKQGQEQHDHKQQGDDTSYLNGLFMLNRL